MKSSANRPFTITLAATAVAASYFSTLILWVIDNGLPRFITSYAILAFLAAIYFGLAFGIYAGSRVARWLCIVFFALSLLAFPFAWPTYDSFAAKINGILQASLWSSALVLLLLKPTRAWLNKA